MRKFTLTVLLVAGFATNLSSQEPATASSPQVEEPQNKDTPNRDELVYGILKEIVNKSELDDEQRKKINKIIDSAATRIAEADKQVEDSISADLQSKYQTAFRAARKVGFDVKQAESYALRKTDITEEQRLRFVGATENAKLVRIKLHNEIASLLTPEQRAKLPMFREKKPTAFHFELRLPKADTEEKLNQVRTELGKVRSSFEFHGKTENEVPGFRLRTEDIEKVRVILDTFRDKRGVELLQDYSIESIEPIFTSNKKKPTRQKRRK